MAYGDKVEIDLACVTDIKVVKIVAKYFKNKSQMLKLECDTKDAYIKETLTNN
jgi:hypothetical protein